MLNATLCRKAYLRGWGGWIETFHSFKIFENVSISWMDGNQSGIRDNYVAAGFFLFVGKLHLLSIRKLKKNSIQTNFIVIYLSTINQRRK